MNRGAAFRARLRLALNRAVALKGKLMSVRFVYFDLGNVLLLFSVHRLCRQLADAAQTTEAEARERLFDERRYRQYERGEISTEDYYNQTCEGFEHKPPFDAFVNAICDVFWANDPILPIVRKLAKHDFPRGVLSNTNPAHWNYVENAFPRIWNAFDDHRIASFNVKSLKPFREIYDAAYQDAKRSIPDLLPEEILFVDDMEENIRAAREFGFQTIHYANFDQFLEQYKATGLPIPSRYLSDSVEGENARKADVGEAPRDEARIAGSDVDEEDEED